VTLLLVGSSNAAIGFPPAMELLRARGGAVDAVVAAVAAVEANPDDHSVGYGGLPNLLGEVELDASLMDGATLAAGSVGALAGYRDAIALARIVMESLPHVLVVGVGAARLAAEARLEPIDLLTPEAERIWRSRLDDRLPGHSAYLARVRDLVAGLARDPEHPDPDPVLPPDPASASVAPPDPPGAPTPRPLRVPDDVHGTVNVIARDAAGHLACGVSTSGWAWKYPGRLGDSPIVGAGNYADDRFGAAACTGRGEMAQRLCTAHSVVMAMRFGRTLDDALTLAAEDLHALPDPYKSEVNIVAVDRDGNPAAVSTIVGKTYVVQTSEMAAAEVRERRFVPGRCRAT
jgi:beta-aspartyl-peptidase (threonine type)